MRKATGKRVTVDGSDVPVVERGGGSFRAGMAGEKRARKPTVFASQSLNVVG
jgi:hypothetical protein